MSRTVYYNYRGEEINPPSMDKVKPTNADRIRSMTDEELAKFIAGQRGWYCEYEDPSEHEYPIVLNWLKQEDE